AGCSSRSEMMSAFAAPPGGTFSHVVAGLVLALALPLVGCPPATTGSSSSSSSSGAPGPAGLGEAGGDPTPTCGTHEGTALQCVDGTCQVPGCATGALGCPCGPGDTCTAAGTSCTGGLCVPMGCQAGTAGCLCG